MWWWRSGAVQVVVCGGDDMTEVSSDLERRRAGGERAVAERRPWRRIEVVAEAGSNVGGGVWRLGRHHRVKWRINAGSHDGALC
jgi:hypothetical protein